MKKLFKKLFIKLFKGARGCTDVGSNSQVPGLGLEQPDSGAPTTQVVAQQSGSLQEERESSP